MRVWNQVRQGEDAAEVVRGFLRDVRSGQCPEKADLYFASRVLAHQVCSEGEQSVVRTAADYEAHIREFLRLFGAFSFSVESFVSQGDLVFVRWRQVGCHLESLNGEKPTGGTLVELTSVVYRVEGGKIVEYWLQTDRKGMEIQLEGHKTTGCLNVL